MYSCILEYLELLSYLLMKLAKVYKKKGTCIDVAIDLVKCLIKYLEKYGEFGNWICVCSKM